MDKITLIGFLVVLLLFTLVFFVFIVPTLEITLGKIGVLIGAIVLLIVFGLMAFKVLK